MHRLIAVGTLCCGLLLGGTARAQDDEGDAESEASGPSAIPFVIAGAGLVALGGGVLFAMSSSSATEDARNATVHEEALEHMESAESATNTANLLYLLGGSLLALGVGWAAVEITDAEDEETATALVIGPGSLALRGSFD